MTPARIAELRALCAADRFGGASFDAMIGICAAMPEVLDELEACVRLRSEERRVLEEQREALRAQLQAADAAIADAEREDERNTKAICELAQVACELQSANAAARAVLDVVRSFNESAKVSAALADFDARFPARRTTAADSDSTPPHTSRAG